MTRTNFNKKSEYKNNRLVIEKFSTKKKKKKTLGPNKLIGGFYQIFQQELKQILQKSSQENGGKRNL